MALAAATRRWNELHEKKPYHDGHFTNWTEKPTPGTPFHYSDGVQLSVAAADVHPDDDFLEYGTDDDKPPA